MSSANTFSQLADNSGDTQLTNGDVVPEQHAEVVEVKRGKKGTKKS